MKYWTHEEEEKLTELLSDSKISWADILDELGRDHSSVMHKAYDI